jgi:hypothetical protein
MKIIKNLPISFLFFNLLIHHQPNKFIPKFSISGDVLSCEKDRSNPFLLNPSLFSNAAKKSFVTNRIDRGKTVMEFMTFEKYLPKPNRIVEIPLTFKKTDEIIEGPKLIYIPKEKCENNELAVIVKSAR